VKEWLVRIALVAAAAVGLAANGLVLDSASAHRDRPDHTASRYAKQWHARAAAFGGKHGKVLRVGRWHGKNGQYATIQDAVDHAKAHDWILVGPGDYKTVTSTAPTDDAESPAGVLVTTPHLTIRGMNRDKVIVDGTKSGPPCSTATADQNFGPTLEGKATGLNGVMVWKANDVRVDNLTACNFLGGPGGSSGNEIWWNGGDDSGTLGGWGFWGNYLTTTSTYFDTEDTAAEYGIFSSNWVGGLWNHSYTSNFNDSGYYIGACRQVCRQTVNHAWSQYSVLGYSGSNSGGVVVVKHSEFDHNQDGFDTNSQNGDNPPPQDGACPKGKLSPITHTHSCWVFTHNYVHDNNNPNAPAAGSAAAGPVGTGVSISGGRDDTITHNRFVRNKAWGVIFVPYPDSGPPCTGGTQTQEACIYDEYGDALLDNTFAHNGGYGNPTNGDFAAVNLDRDPTDCFHGNREKGGGKVTSSPSNAQSMYPKCTGKTVDPDLNFEFLAQVACDSGASIGPVGGGDACPPGTSYPRQTKVVMHPLPGAASLESPATATLPTMPKPCRGVPVNPWCPAHH
jgi:hypothetical protein